MVGGGDENGDDGGVACARDLGVVGRCGRELRSAGRTTSTGTATRPRSSATSAPKGGRGADRAMRPGHAGGAGGASA